MESWSKIESWSSFFGHYKCFGDLVVWHLMWSTLELEEDNLKVTDVWSGLYEKGVIKCVCSLVMFVWSNAVYRNQSEARK